MDLKTYLFTRGITLRQFALMMGLDYNIAHKIMRRISRPRGERAHLISRATGGQVTVDELVNPQNYPVFWSGDGAKKVYQRKLKPKEPTAEKLSAVNPLMPLKKPKRKRNGQGNKENPVDDKEGKQAAKEPCEG